MRLFPWARRRAAAPLIPSLVGIEPAALAAAVLRAQKAGYADGLADGTEVALAHLDGKGATSVVGVYDGPMPTALEAWIARTRARLGEERARRAREKRRAGGWT